MASPSLLCLRTLPDARYGVESSISTLMVEATDELRMLGTINKRLASVPHIIPQLNVDPSNWHLPTQKRPKPCHRISPTDRLLATSADRSGATDGTCPYKAYATPQQGKQLRPPCDSSALGGPIKCHHSDTTPSHGVAFL